MNRLGLTLVRRVCSFCGEPKGLGLWRWKGSVFVTTHTLCGSCLRERIVAFGTQAAETPGS